VCVCVCVCVFIGATGDACPKQSTFDMREIKSEAAKARGEPSAAANDDFEDDPDCPPLE